MPGESGTGTHMVVEVRDSQVFLQCDHSEGQEGGGFYKKPSRASMVPGRAHAEEAPQGPGCISLVGHCWPSWRIQHSSLSKRISSQKTSKAVEELNTINHLHLIDINTPIQTSRTLIKQEHIF